MNWLARFGLWIDGGKFDEDDELWFEKKLFRDFKTADIAFLINLCAFVFFVVVLAFLLLLGVFSGLAIFDAFDASGWDYDAGVLGLFALASFVGMMIFVKYFFDAFDSVCRDDNARMARCVESYVFAKKYGFVPSRARMFEKFGRQIKRMNGGVRR